MKSIERRFAKLQQFCPETGSYIHFAQAVTGGQFAPASIRRWFYRLVEKDDFDPRDKVDIFTHLDQLTNRPRTTKIDGKLVPRAALATTSISETI